MKNGNIVWAKIREESSGACYWPGLMQTRDSHGVLVSFFNYQSPRYFQDSEIRPFSENFLQSTPTELIGACDALLDRALRWLCRRTALSLRCQCRPESAAAAKIRGDLEMVIGDGEVLEAKKSFRPEAVLGFVRNKAVLAWVEVGDFVEAVKSIAEVQVFRDYNAIGQKSVYRKGRRARWRNNQRGTHLELQSHPSSKSMAANSHNLELDFESQASPKPEDMNLEVGVASMVNSTILLSMESFQPLHEDQLEKQLVQVQKEEEQSLYEVLVSLRRLALDSFCLGANCLNTTEQSLLGFRSILFEKVSDMHIKKCSPLKSIEAYLSHPGYFETQPSVEADGEKCENEVCGSIVSYIKRFVRSLGYKRRLDLPAFCGSPFKLNKSMPFFSINGSRHYLQINRTEAEVSLSNALLSNEGVDFDLDINGTDWEETSHIHFLSKTQNSRALIPTYASNTGLLDFFHNISDLSLLKELAQLSNIIEISKDREPKVKHVCGYNVKLQELGGNSGIEKDYRNRNNAVFNTPEKTINGFQNEDMKDGYSFCLLQHSATQVRVSDMFGTDASDVEKVNHDAATEISRSEFRLIPKSQMQTSDDKGAFYVKSNREAVRLNVASEDRIENIKKLQDSCTSGLLLNLHKAQQSKALARFAGSKSLHMKFPKDYTLPSKEELVRKFRQFGPIDSLKTKIFNYTGSAQVVFFNQWDAMAAYQYAKRKKLLPGQPNVRYWFDPFESKRGGAKLLTGKPLEPELKSCLRISNSPGTEDKRKQQKVRFLMETGS